MEIPSFRHPNHPTMVSSLWLCWWLAHHTWHSLVDAVNCCDPHLESSSCLSSDFGKEMKMKHWRTDDFSTVPYRFTLTRPISQFQCLLATYEDVNGRKQQQNRGCFLVCFVGVQEALPSSFLSYAKYAACIVRLFSVLHSSPWPPTVLRT